jgi:hypothetical protein
MWRLEPGNLFMQNPGDFSEAYSPSVICLEKVLFLEKAIETIWQESAHYKTLQNETME